MPRPSVLVVDSEASRRRELSHGLSAFGYEVIPAVDAQEGQRFADGLGPGIVVAPLAIAADGDGSLLARFASADSREHTLLILGKTEEEGRELPQEVLFLVADGLPGADLVRRIHLVLLGREIGVEPDSGVESLVGDFSLLPPLELLRALNRAHVTGRVVCAEGEITLDEGGVKAAAAGRSRGTKAFLRLSHLTAGPFWVQLRPPPAILDGEIRQDLTSLIFLSLEDRVHDAPDPRARLRVKRGPAFFETPFTPRQQELLAL
ncbi:MAG TPA: hypothetical protein VL025_12300, partial [Thermoanaerobaculia bacterium]|nr:hypothetical protein [Thermoanaerobaculia bacterium]